MTAMNLYRRSTLQASLVLLLAGIVGFTTAVAQRHKPHKLRATALLEFSREGSANRPMLVPVTILEDGSFHDASIYKAAPEPMALGDGVIYEAFDPEREDRVVVKQLDLHINDPAFASACAAKLLEMLKTSPPA